MFFPKFIESVEIIRIMSLGVISATVGQMYSSRLLGTEKSKHVVIGRWISAVTMIICIITLGSIFNAVGLSMAFVLSTTTYVVYLLLVDNIKIKK
jgi:O-antigen/teichoic acid export membrane protein